MRPLTAHSPRSGSHDSAARSSGSSSAIRAADDPGDFARSIAGGRWDEQRALGQQENEQAQHEPAPVEAPAEQDPAAEHPERIGRHERRHDRAQPG